MENRNEPKPVLPDFGEPLDPKLLQNFATVTKRDLEDAERWFDENASEEWKGALDNAVER